MNPDRYQRAKAIFLDACDLPGARREAYLAEACGGDEALRDAVRELLAGDAEPLPALDAGSRRAGLERLLGEAEPAPEAPACVRIGAYRVVRLIGMGGMGAVYEAEQESPRRRVAIKVLRPGLATPRALRRFEHEAQLLGRLEHPAIARIYEAGVAEVEDESGACARQPYFAMELVQGEPLDEHIARTRPPDEEKLELIARVCDAVHHAHARGIIHRDLKPANVLIEPGAGPSGGGAPRILDFGIARLANTDLHTVSIETGTGQILGTLASMSPEQVAGRPDDLDTRSDVYSLGVILYESLCGRPPVDLSDCSIPEAARRIREDEPVRLGSVDPRFRGDVETIAGKALAKDRAHRYQSASALAEDIRRFLRDEPIAARPPSTVYQLRKFARRNKALVGAAGVVAVVLVVAAILSTWLAVRESAARELAEAERSAAVNEARKYRAVLEFLREMISAADPAVGPNRADATIRQVLDVAAEDVARGSLDETPDVAVAVKATIGNTYRALDEREKAIRFLREAVALGMELHPEGDEDLSWALNKLARALENTGEYEEAERRYRRALAMRERLYGRGSAETATILNNLGWLRVQAGAVDEGERLLTEALAIRREVFGDRHGEVATSLNNLAIVRFRRGDAERAVEMLRESLEIDLELKGERHPNVATTINNLAFGLKATGRFDQAEAMFRRSLELRREMFGARHTMVANALGNLGTLLHAMGRLEEAERALRGAYDLERELRGPDHPLTQNAAVSLGGLLVDRATYDEAEALLAPALASLQDELGEDHRRSIRAGLWMGRLRLAQRRPGEAAPLLEKTARLARVSLGTSHVDSALALVACGRCHTALGRFEEAERELLGAHGVLEATGTPRDRDRCARALASLYEAWGRPEEAARWRGRPD